MKRYALAILVLLLLGVPGTRPAFGVSKEIQYIMQQLDSLQQTVQNIKKDMDAQAADLRNLIEQANRNVTSMKSTITDLQKATDQNLASSNARFDSMTSQIQAFSESLEEVKARLAKLSEQMVQTQNIIQTLNSTAPAGSKNPPPPGTNTRGSTNVPDADSLYNSALSYYNGGQYQLAMQAFQDYLQYYGDTDRASNAQFYIGENYYSLGNYAQAVDEYNKCLERYPGGNKQAAAQLKKGYALLALGQNQAGVRELRSLAQRYPNSHEADLARQRLKKLGINMTARHGE